MNDLSARLKSVRPLVSVCMPLALLLGTVAAMGLFHAPQPAEPQTMQSENCIAPQLKSPRFASVWAITLHNQYAVSQRYRRALQTAQSRTARVSLEQRYNRVATEYNRMAQEAPSRAFQSLPQPRALPE